MMPMKLFYVLVIVSIWTLLCYLYSLSERVQFTFMISRSTFDVTEAHRRAQEIPPCDCCGNQSDWKDEFLRIPKRLHQTYKTDQIPEQYVPLIRTWLQNHPDWEYYFWSDKEAECLINDLYPQYLDVYKTYKHKLQRSDAIRYFVLHAFGGVYADMDMRSLRPIEPFLCTNTCVVVPEPYVQTQLQFNYPWLITNCIMASTAYHPFLTYLLEGLRSASTFRGGTFSMGIFKTTGPFFLNDTYNSYLQKFSNRLNRTHRNVYLADFKYLVPRFSEEIDASVHKKFCSGSELGAPFRKKGCDELTKTNFFNDLPAAAYADHLWLHLGWKPQDKYKSQSIESVAPRVKRYGACDIP